MANLLIGFWKVRANYAYTMWKINAHSQESTVQKLSTTSSAKAKTWAQWVCQNKNYIFRLIFKFTSVLKCMQNCWPKKVHKKTGLGHFFRPSFFLNLFQKLFVTEVNLHLGNQTKINTFIWIEYDPWKISTTLDFVYTFGSLGNHFTKTAQNCRIFICCYSFIMSYVCQKWFSVNAKRKTRGLWELQIDWYISA